MIVGTLLPPDQDGGFFQGDLNLHAPIISETAQEIHGKYGFVSCQPFNLHVPIIGVKKFVAGSAADQAGGGADGAVA